ncbi:MAG: hypothetical protein PHI37_01325 [Candidatus Gracilibacteria bacterium]|nr:hypothetical protein [Candidatus Gracilibacteria bacterium]
MKKFKKILSFVIIGILSFGISYAELEVINISISDNTSTGIIISNNEVIDTSTGSTQDTSYIYYYGQGCSHCANLDKYLTKVGGYDKLDIVKKEVYFNDENREEMISEGKRLGLSESDIGVPFFIINASGKETPLIGDGQIIENLKPILGEIPENNKKPIVFTILVILAIIVPVFLIKLSNKS